VKLRLPFCTHTRPRKYLAEFEGEGNYLNHIFCFLTVSLSRSELIFHLQEGSLGNHNRYTADDRLHSLQFTTP
jgi:hypothetical protein